MVDKKTPQKKTTKLYKSVDEDDNDFVMTIISDEEDNNNNNNNNNNNAKKGKKENGKQKPQQQQQQGGEQEESDHNVSSDDDMNELEFNEGTEFLPVHSWDLSNAMKAVVREETQHLTSLEDKINNRLEEKQKKEDLLKEKQKAKKKREEAKKKGYRYDKDAGSDEGSDGNESESETKEKLKKIKREKIEFKASAEDELTELNSGRRSRVERVEEKKEEENEEKVTFMELNLSRPLLRAIEKLGYTYPTPIQIKAIPPVLMGKDILASALTGSGKTAAFLLPILERLLHRDKSIQVTRVLILTPTRELALQCQSVLDKLSAFAGIKSCIVVGGLSNKLQEIDLQNQPDIVIATPGRLIDHLLNSKSIGLDDLEILVLDEADRLLDMGFQDELTQILDHLPADRQTLLFSATLSHGVKELARLSLGRDVIRVAVDQLFDTSANLAQEFVKVPSEGSVPLAILLALCTRSVGPGTIVFLREKKDAHRMCILFGLAKLRAAELHGNLTQAQRMESLQNFRDGMVDYLIATDVAARGLDIIGTQTVINYHMPKNITQYTHRVGRTARAGKGGKAISFIRKEDKMLMKDVLKHVKGGKAKNRVVPEEVVDHWLTQLEDFEKDIHAILEREKHEKVLKFAERDAQKADNILKHSEEIFSRPQKNWFQSNAERKEAQEKAKQELNLLGFQDWDDKSKGKKPKEKNTNTTKKRKVDIADLPRKLRRREEALRDAEGSDVFAASRRAKVAMRKGELAPKIRKPKQHKQEQTQQSRFKQKMRDLERGFKKVRLNKQKGVNKFKTKSRYNRKK